MLRVRECVEVRAYGKTVSGQENCIKDWEFSLQAAKRAAVGNISRQRGLNYKEIDNTQNYYGV